MNPISHTKATKNKKYSQSAPREDIDTCFPQDLFQKNLQAAAEKLQIDKPFLQRWIESQKRPSLIASNSFLKAIHEFDLDPFNGEIIFIHSHKESKSVWPFITIEGWIKLINQHPQFCAIEFNFPIQENQINHKWIECAIYRKDRIKPITIREYLAEVITEQAGWKDRPNRMLRHRALAQCAKLAFGICIAESPIQRDSSRQAQTQSLTANQLKMPNSDRISVLKEILHKPNKSTYGEISHGECSKI